MFYFLSKVLFYVLMPLSLILIGLGFALFSKKTKVKKRSLQISLGFIFLFGNGFLINEVLLSWEVTPISPNDINQTYDVGIILTGGMITNKLSTESQIFTDKTADRFIQPLRLYKMGKLKKILISGGNTDISIMRQDVSDETLKVAQLLEELGVRKEDIILERKAKNTRENAVNTAEILKKKPQFGNKYILFTSAFHLRRAEGCFAKAGVSVLPFGTTYKARARSFTIDNLLIPRELNLLDAYDLIHEIIGFVVYKTLKYC
ncbi:MAG: YdcF family protein [Bacteroidota bacterium]